MENNEPDGILLKRYVTQRDEAAFTQLVQRHIAVVFATAFRKLNDSTGAEEATQNVFITLARRAPWLCGHPSLVGWLHRATLHFSHHQLRANQRRRNREQLAFELGTSMNINDANTSELASVLDDALLELRESDREAILLRFFANHSLRQMGTVLGIRENSAQKRVAKALDHLAQLFRRKGYKVSGAAALAIALQHMPANAVPAALLSTTAKTALAAGTATSFGGITVYIAKIMSLTKVQTAVICLTLAAVPLSYEWYSRNLLVARAAVLNHQIKTLRSDLLGREEDQANTEMETLKLNRRLAELRETRPPAGSVSPVQEQLNPFIWDENSAFVRIPKSILGGLRFASFGAKTNADGSVDHYQLPSIDVNGNPQPALRAALGLSSEESGKLDQICQAAFTSFQDLVSQRSEVVQKPFLDGQALNLKTPALKEEGLNIQLQLRSQLVSLLGPERADAFWNQSQNVFSDILNDFGAYPRETQVMLRPNIPLEYLESYRGSSRIGKISDRNGNPLPPLLQTAVDSWNAARAHQP